MINDNGNERLMILFHKDHHNGDFRDKAGCYRKSSFECYTRRNASILALNYYDGETKERYFRMQDAGHHAVKQ